MCKEADNRELVSSTKPVGELNEKYVFFVPSYQRGYRWGKSQVEELLDDIDSFVPLNPDNDDEIYCIQPLVVYWDKENNRYDVVDGQQRLTTILLILNTIDAENDHYQITYDTRSKESAAYLKFSLEEMEKVDQNGVKQYEKNIDFYHMHEVKEAIEEWFDGKEEYKKRFRDKLKKRVQFIWYPIDENENESEVFARLNIGKIPLTDAELVKGLFLNRYNYEILGLNQKDIISERHLRIATEWDQIEYALQNDEFWLFVQNHTGDMPTRIGFLLDIVAELDYLKLNKIISDDKDDKHRTYRYFNDVFKREYDRISEERKNNNTEELIKENIAWVDNIWKEIISIYRIFDEWYHDPVMFHYVGYLITVSYDKKEPIQTNKEMIHKLIGVWKGNSYPDKRAFVVYLKEQIKGILTKKVWYNEWSEYRFDQDGGKGKSDTTELLLLHNVETILRQSDFLRNNPKYNLPVFNKFAFHYYKKEEWNIEHIRPDSDDRFVDKDKILWDHIELYVDLAKETLASDNSAKVDRLYKDLMDMKDKNSTNESLIEKFNEIKSIISNDDSIDDDNKNRIFNYTLLDESDNKGYQNYTFVVKRLYLLKKEQGQAISPKNAPTEIKKGEINVFEKNQVPFIPPCTRNVFTKYYTPLPTSLVEWTETDANYYLKDMESVLKDYLPAIMTNQGKASN